MDIEIDPADKCQNQRKCGISDISENKDIYRTDQTHRVLGLVSPSMELIYSIFPQKGINIPNSILRQNI